MRKIILAFSGLLLAGTAHAQLGVSAGPNFTALVAKTSNSHQHARVDGHVGYDAGIFYEQALGGRFSVVPELRFSRQYVDLTVEDFSSAIATGRVSFRLTLSSLTLPVLARATFGRFYVEAGPQASMILAAHEKGTESLSAPGTTFERPVDRDAKDFYQRFDAGLSAGLGLKLPAGFGLGLRAYGGFRSLPKERDNGYNYDGKLRNLTVQALVSYRLKAE